MQHVVVERRGDGHAVAARREIGPPGTRDAHLPAVNEGTGQPDRIGDVDAAVVAAVAAHVGGVDLGEGAAARAEADGHARGEVAFVEQHLAGQQIFYAEIARRIAGGRTEPRSRIVYRRDAVTIVGEAEYPLVINGTIG